MEVIKKGVPYWQDLLKRGNTANILSLVEQNYIRELITFIMRGTIPCSANGTVPVKTMTMISRVLEAEVKMNDEGYAATFEADDDLYEMTLTNYTMH